MVDFGVFAFFLPGLDHAFEFFFGERQVFGGEFNQMVFVIRLQAFFHVVHLRVHVSADGFGEPFAAHGIDGFFLRLVQRRVALFVHQEEDGE